MVKSQFDLTKFVFSFVMIALHSEILFGTFLYPLSRVAVPIYFMMSSYFLFTKLNNSENQREILLSFLKRNLKLYLFWFIIFSPIVAYLISLQSNNFLDFCLKLILKFLFSNTFYASWYIMASILAVLIIYSSEKVVIKKCKKIEIAGFLIIFLLYSICCLSSNYFFLIKDNLVGKIYLQVQLLLGVPHNNFIVGIVWMKIGKKLAENNKKQNSSKIGVLLLAFTFLLLIEHYLITKYNGNVKDNDCYIMLVPVCIFFFCLLKNTYFELKNSLLLRKASTIIYCSHLSILVILRQVLSQFIVVREELHILLFILTVFCTLLVVFIILKLEKYLTILKNAY